MAPRRFILFHSFFWIWVKNKGWYSEKIRLVDLLDAEYNKKYMTNWKDFEGRKKYGDQAQNFLYPGHKSQSRTIANEWITNNSVHLKFHCLILHFVFCCYLLYPFYYSQPKNNSSNLISLTEMAKLNPICIWSRKNKFLFCEYIK